MKKIKYLLFVLIIVLLSSCSDYVNNINKPVQVADDKDIDQADITFLTRGIQFRYSQTVMDLLMCAEGLSDEFVFDRDVPNATFPQYDEIDKGEMLTDNNVLRGIYNNLGELRFYSDDMLGKVAKATQITDAVRKNSLYVGNLYGGLARYYLGSYFGKRRTIGGATINKSAFIPTDQLYAQALEKYKAALENAPNDAAKRIVNTHIARVYLFTNDYVNALKYAKDGMKEGDANFMALYSKEFGNDYYFYAGRYRGQFTVSPRFQGYIDANPEEAGRIIIEPTPGTSGATHYLQAKVLKEEDPLVTATWQENSLMLAELTLRGQAAGDALTLVNKVRASHEIKALTTINLDGIYVERDKELNCMGLRLIDQRRFNKFHLAGKWQYFPITIDELNSNPNTDLN